MAILPDYAAIKERLVANADVALVGVDDEPCREIYARLKARAGAPRAVAISGKESPLADIWVTEHRVMARGEAAPAADLAAARALRGAHNGQNAAFAYAAARTLGVERELIAARLLNLSRPRPSHGGSRPVWPGAVRQRLEGDQRRRGRKGAALLSRHPLDRRRQAEGGRRRAAARALPARREGLPDRRIERRIRADARRRGSFRTLRDPKRGDRSGGRGRGALASEASLSSCCRRPVRPSISSPISRRAATPFARSSPNGSSAARRPAMRAKKEA